MQHRQGDVFFQKVESLPEGLKKQNSNILVYGKSTGHAHRLKEGQVFTGQDGAMFIKISKKGLVVHEEHNTITLDKGIWAVIRQREYTLEAIRTVVD